MKNTNSTPPNSHSQWTLIALTGLSAEDLAEALKSLKENLGDDDLCHFLALRSDGRHNGSPNEFESPPIWLEHAGPNHTNTNRNTSPNLRSTFAQRDEEKDVDDQPPRLTISRHRPHCQINDTPIRLGPVEHQVVLFFALNRRKGTKFSFYRDAFEAYLDFAEQRLANCPEQPYRELLRKHADTCREQKALINTSAPADADYQLLTKTISRLRCKFAKANGDAAILARILPRAGSPHLDLPPDAIELLD